MLKAYIEMSDANQIQPSSSSALWSLLHLCKVEVIYTFAHAVLHPC